MSNMEQPLQEKTPFEELATAAETKLRELFPKAKKHNLSQVVSPFVSDLLNARGVSGARIYHRVPAEKQRVELAEAGITPENLFKNIPEGILQHYAKLLDDHEDPKKGLDPLMMLPL